MIGVFVVCSVLAELMLPEGAHSRDVDFTVFFLKYSVSEPLKCWKRGFKKLIMNAPCRRLLATSQPRSQCRWKLGVGVLLE